MHWFLWGAWMLRVFFCGKDIGRRSAGFVKSHLSQFDIIFMRTPLGTIGVFRSAGALFPWLFIWCRYIKVAALYCSLIFYLMSSTKVIGLVRSMHFVIFSHAICPSNLLFAWSWLIPSALLLCDLPRRGLGAETMAILDVLVLETWSDVNAFDVWKV